MSDPYIGEIRMFGFGRVPQGWLACDGSVISISNYEPLFVLLGTTYGGNGTSTFGVPDLRGSVPIHQGAGLGLTPHALGQRGGTETVTLSVAQMPQHTHALKVTGVAATLDTPGPTTMPAAVSGENFYVSDVVTGATAVAMEPTAVSYAGGSQPHENCMPTLTVQYCIAWQGIFPQQA